MDGLIPAPLRPDGLTYHDHWLPSGGVVLRTSHQPLPPLHNGDSVQFLTTLKYHPDGSIEQVESTDLDEQALEPHNLREA